MNDLPMNNYLLLNIDEDELLQYIILVRFISNTGMSWKEVIQVTAYLGDGVFISVRK